MRLLMPKVEIIAELAQGFEGRPEQARLLMKAAAKAGADAAKYQLVYADELATPDYKYYGLFRSLEMDDSVWESLSAYSSELGIQLQLDIFGPKSLQLAERIGAAGVKLHATDLANLSLLQAVADSSARCVLLGAGGAHASEIEMALAILAAKPVVVVLGFQGYPTPDDANQIARVSRLVDRSPAVHPNMRVGFADHADHGVPLRYAMAAAAAGAGATVIEKHLTLGRLMKLEDHESALNPDEFAEFVQVVRGCALAIGVSTEADDFGMSDAERGYRSMIRRHVVANRSLCAGTALGPADLALKRTSATEPLTDPRLTYGRTLTRDVPKDAAILDADLAGAGSLQR